MTEHVVVRAFRGVALNRWMVGVLDNVAVITDRAGADAVQAGLDPLRSLGFPKEDIFVSPDCPVPDGSVPNWAEMRRRF